MKNENLQYPSHIFEYSTYENYSGIASLRICFFYCHIFQDDLKFGYIADRTVYDVGLKKCKVVPDTVISAHFDTLCRPFEGCFIARLNGKWGVVNFKNQIISPFEWDRVSQPVYSNYKGLLVTKNGLLGLIALDGNIIAQPKYLSIEPVWPNFSNMWPRELDLIKVTTIDGKLGYLNNKGIEFFEN